MTRFDADTPTDRRKLFADAVVAHRERASSFLTIEADEAVLSDRDPADDGSTAEATSTAEDAESDGAETPERQPPWLQFAERTFNLDCTDAELDRLKELLSEYPEFRIDDLESPDDAAGTNVRVSARSDANRLADFADRVFRTVYDCEEEYRAWAVEV
ncbi:MAG: hypothetical protein ABEJ79_04690 [Halolamina sp.]